MSKKLFLTFRKSIFRDITAFGGSPFYGALILFLLAIWQINLAFKLIIGLIIIVFVAVFIRTFYYKARPKELSHTNWFEKIEASSFPSIHATRATFLALIFTNLYSSFAVWILMIFSVFAICYSRIHMKRHDTMDVIAGIILGIITFLLINKIFSVFLL